MTAVVLFDNTVGGVAVTIVLIAAVVALVLIGVRAMGLNVPEWAKQALTVVAVAVAIILLIRLVLAA